MNIKPTARNGMNSKPKDKNLTCLQLLSSQFGPAESRPQPTHAGSISHAETNTQQSNTSVSSKWQHSRRVARADMDAISDYLRTVNLTCEHVFKPSAWLDLTLQFAFFSIPRSGDVLSIYDTLHFLLATLHFREKLGGVVRWVTAALLLLCIFGKSRVE